MRIAPSQTPQNVVCYTKIPTEETNAMPTLDWIGKDKVINHHMAREL